MLTASQQKMNKYLSAVLAASMLCSCQINNSILQQQKEKEPVRVKVMTASPAEEIFRNTYMGKAVPAREVTLTAPFSGTLKSLNVRKGSVVNENSVVAGLSSQSVESAYLIAKADLNQAEDAMERVKKVYSNGAVTEVQMKDIQTKLEKARSAMASASKAMSDCSIKSPYRGIVSETFHSAGEEIKIGERIAIITDLSDFKIEIPVHENEIGSVTEGMDALVDIPALGIENEAAYVCEKGILSSSLAHSYLCALKTKRTINGLMSGMAVKVRFESKNDQQRIVIPASAIQLDAEGKYVWISDSCIVKKRRIVSGGYSGKGVIVSEGLKEGDKLITEGYQKVSSGMKVKEVE